MMLCFLAGLMVWNLFVFAAYYFDKRKAVKNQWRTPEKTLLLMSICLGGAGAFMAGRLFHHKTKKWYFTVSWYAGIILTAITIYLIWRMK